MKKCIHLIASMMLAAALCACGGNSDPKELAVEFAEAYLNGNFDKCNSMMGEGSPRDFTPEKEMNESEKALLAHIRENAKKMKYRIVVDEAQTEIRETFAMVELTITSQTDPELNYSVNVDLSLDSDSGKWGVELYGNRLNKLITR